jgi:hypothetical protein
VFVVAEFLQSRSLSESKIGTEIDSSDRQLRPTAQINSMQLHKVGMSFLAFKMKS